MPDLLGQFLLAIKNHNFENGKEPSKGQRYCKTYLKSPIHLLPISPATVHKYTVGKWERKKPSHNSAKTGDYQ